MTGHDTNTKGTNMNAREINNAHEQIALLNDELYHLTKADRNSISEDAGEIATRLAEIRQERDRLRKLVA
jgi:hypothetical protein